MVVAHTMLYHSRKTAGTAAACQTKLMNRFDKAIKDRVAGNGSNQGVKFEVGIQK
jgi:hypothetical protein